MDECMSKLGDRLPVAHVVCNQNPPIGDEPSLMTFREVETLFHEFVRHAHLHWMHTCIHNLNLNPPSPPEIFSARIWVLVTDMHVPNAKRSDR